MHPNVPQCQYIKTNGIRCGSPALSRQRYCYFHYEVDRPKISFNIPALEDANAIQLALTDVARAVADERLDLRRATVLGYLMQTASANLKRVVLGCPTSVTEIPGPDYSGSLDHDDPGPASAEPEAGPPDPAEVRKQAVRMISEAAPEIAATLRRRKRGA